MVSIQIVCTCFTRFVDLYENWYSKKTLLGLALRVHLFKILCQSPEDSGRERYSLRHVVEATNKSLIYKMASEEKEPLAENRLEWEEPKPEKKEWRVWGKNLMKRRTTKQLIEDALLMRFKDQRTIQVFDSLFFIKSHLLFYIIV